MGGEADRVACFYTTIINNTKHTHTHFAAQRKGQIPDLHRPYTRTRMLFLNPYLPANPVRTPTSSKSRQRAPHAPFASPSHQPSTLSPNLSSPPQITHHNSNPKDCISRLLSSLLDTMFCSAALPCSFCPAFPVRARAMSSLIAPALQASA